MKAHKSDGRFCCDSNMMYLYSHQIIIPSSNCHSEFIFVSKPYTTLTSHSASRVFNVSFAYYTGEAEGFRMSTDIDLLPPPPPTPQISSCPTAASTRARSPPPPVSTRPPPRTSPWPTRPTPTSTSTGWPGRAPTRQRRSGRV